MPVYVYAIVAAGWALWLAPFPRRWNNSAAHTNDHRSRWGLLLQSIGYVLVWLGPLRVMHPAAWRVALSVIFMALAALLSWTATSALGKHLRFVAAIGDDHELVRKGPYAVIRHPIYASMLCVLLGTGVVLTPVALFAPAILIFLVGTEIRVRVEDNLLARHFGDEFSDYRKSVPAYIPLVR